MTASISTDYAIFKDAPPKRSQNLLNYQSQQFTERVGRKNHAFLPFPFNFFVTSTLAVFVVVNYHYVILCNDIKC